MRAALVALAIIGAAMLPTGRGHAATPPAWATGCQPSKPDPRLTTYNTTNYLTTWGSAWTEGAMEGFREGVASDTVTYTTLKMLLREPLVDGDEVFNRLPGKPKPFCRSYIGDKRKVAAIVDKLLPALGNPIELRNAKAGVFKTGLIQREHPAAQWKDSYLIVVDEAEPGLVVVRVLRRVYISRTPGVFNEGKSSGRNEGWILNQIGERLAPSR